MEKEYEALDYFSRDTGKPLVLCQPHGWALAVQARRRLQDLITDAMSGEENEKFTQIVRTANCLL